MKDVILKILLGWNLGIILGLVIFTIVSIVYLIYFNFWDIVDFLKG